MPELYLAGCTTEPLMSYLKALGVLRLVTEQVDQEARASWRDGVFILDTTLDSDRLVRFFLGNFEPTPLLAPWNAGSGFYTKLDLDRLLESRGKTAQSKSRDAVDAIGAIEKSDVERLSRYREQIRLTKTALGELGERVDFSGKKAALRLAADGSTVVEVIVGSRTEAEESHVEQTKTIESTIVAVDLPSRQITFTNEREKNPFKPTKVREGARIVVSGKEASLDDIKPGTLAEPLERYRIALSDDQRKTAKDQAAKTLNDMFLFQDAGITFSIGKAAKDDFISELRGRVLTDDGLMWLDAALAMRTGQKKNRVEAPVLGSGGNIGNSDFSARFAQMLREIIPFRKGEEVARQLGGMVEGIAPWTSRPGLLEVSVDQFDPGRAGGANGTQGMEAGPMINPWDYVLMLEGALTLGGTTSRRLGTGRNSVSFPFAVESSAVGYGSAGKDRTRGEVWLPIWSSLCSFPEIKLLLSEGRAEIGRERAWSGVTFAQAVAGLGIDRGIRAFVRYEFQARLGDNYLATPIGLFDVPDHPREGIDLVRSLNQLLSDLRQVATDDKAPARLSAAVRRIDAAIFDFCKYGGAERLADLLGAVGAAERESAAGEAPPGKRRTRVGGPLAGLSPDWLKASDDGSTEFRLARSLAFLRGDIDKTGPIRRYMEPVKQERAGWLWGERGGHVVWSGGDLDRNLGAVLTRRVMDADGAGEDPLPLSSLFPASLPDLMAFLAGQIDAHKLEDLIWGLMLIDPKDALPPHWHADDNFILPSAYALLKLTLLPGGLEWIDLNGKMVLSLKRQEGGETPTGIAVKPKPAILAKLRAGDVRAACEIAARRLQASGFVALASHSGDGSRRDIDWSTSGIPPARLLASLLFPISSRCVNDFAGLVLRRPTAESLA